MSAAITTLTRAMEFGYSPATRSVAVHFNAWRLAPTRYLSVGRRFLREQPGHALDVGPRPAD